MPFWCHFADNHLKCNFVIFLSMFHWSFFLHYFSFPSGNGLSQTSVKLLYGPISPKYPYTLLPLMICRSADISGLSVYILCITDPIKITSQLLSNCWYQLYMKTCMSKYIMILITLPLHVLYSQVSIFGCSDKSNNGHFFIGLFISQLYFTQME